MRPSDPQHLLSLVPATRSQRLDPSAASCSCNNCLSKDQHTHTHIHVHTWRVKWPTSCWHRLSVNQNTQIMPHRKNSKVSISITFSRREHMRSFTVQLRTISALTPSFGCPMLALPSNCPQVSAFSPTVQYMQMRLILSQKHSTISSCSCPHCE